MNIKEPVEFCILIGAYKFAEGEWGVFHDFPDKTNEYVNRYGEGHIILERYLSDTSRLETMLFSMGLTTDMDEGDYIVTGRVGLGEREYQMFLEFEGVNKEVYDE